MQIKDKQIKNLVGKRFGHWLVLDYAGVDNHAKNHWQKWLCRCDCGVERVVNGANLKKGFGTVGPKSG